MPVTKRLRIRGRVQGVGFRIGFTARARAQGVIGWVRNRTDGSVEALVQASRAQALEPLLAWARHGPAGARVDRFDIEDLPSPGEELPRPFESRPTV